MPVPSLKSTDFDILRLTPDATEADVRTAYKSLALKWHPDRHATDKEEARRKFIEINDAYRTLLEHYQHLQKDKVRQGRIYHKPSRWFSSSTSAFSSSSGSSRAFTSLAEHLHHSHTEDRLPKSNSHPSSPRHARPSPQSKKYTPRHNRVRCSHEYDSEECLDDDDFVKMNVPVPSDGSKLRRNHHTPHNVGNPINPLRSPASKGNLTQDWIFPLQVTLEDLCFGARHHYRITRTRWSGEDETVRIDIDILPGWQKGEQIRMPGVGNERKDGSFQDIVFILEQAPHSRYTRFEDDLVYTVQVPWVDFHVRPRQRFGSDYSDCGIEEEDVLVPSMDGEEYVLPLPRTLVEGADLDADRGRWHAHSRRRRGCREGRPVGEMGVYIP